MKKRQIFFLVAICTLITVPLMGQDVKGDIEIGDYTLEVAPGFHIIWNVTSANNFEVSTVNNNTHMERPVSVGDQFKFIFIGEGTFNSNDPWMGSGDPLSHPCISGIIMYYNSTDESWHYILGSQYYYYMGTRSYAFLMHNMTSNTYYGSFNYYRRYLLFMLPSNINLTKLGEDLLFESARPNSYSFPWTGYSATSNTLNLTYNEYYNYLKLDQGVVKTWDYYYKEPWESFGRQIVCKYLSSGYEAPNPPSPLNPGGYFIIIGICAIAVTIFARKKILRRREIQRLLSLE